MGYLCVSLSFQLLRSRICHLTTVVQLHGRATLAYLSIGRGHSHLTTVMSDWTEAWALKGKLGDFFLLAQSFYLAQTKRSLNWQFSPKSPKVGQKTGRSVKNWPNKTPFAFNLLWESTNSVIGAAVGIHQFLHPTCCGNPLFGNFSIRPTVGIHQFLHRSCCGNPPILS